jgi:hypothetical protein
VGWRWLTGRKAKRAAATAAATRAAAQEKAGCGLLLRELGRLSGPLR